MYSIHLSIYLSLTWEGICLFEFFLQWDIFFVIFCLIHCYKLFLFLHLKQINFWYSKIITFLKYSFWDLKFFFFYMCHSQKNKLLISAEYPKLLGTQRTCVNLWTEKWQALWKVIKLWKDRQWEKRLISSMTYWIWESSEHYFLNHVHKLWNKQILWMIWVSDY